MKRLGTDVSTARVLIEDLANADKKYWATRLSTGPPSGSGILGYFVVPDAQLSEQVDRN